MYTVPFSGRILVGRSKLTAYYDVTLITKRKIWRVVFTALFTIIRTILGFLCVLKVITNVKKFS